MGLAPWRFTIINYTNKTSDFMANRAYLYSSDTIQGAQEEALTGISEFNWDIPLIFKILLRVKSFPSLSLISRTIVMGSFNDLLKDVIFLEI